MILRSIHETHRPHTKILETKDMNLYQEFQNIQNSVLSLWWKSFFLTIREIFFSHVDFFLQQDQKIGSYVTKLETA